MRVLLEAPVLTQSGYGEHSRFIFRALKNEKNIQLFINPLNWGKTGWLEDLGEDLKDEYEEISKCIKDLGDLHRQFPETWAQSFDLHIHVGILNEFKRKAHKSICVTAGIETDKISPSWIVKSYEETPNKVIVPSTHAKEGFLNTKVLKQQKNKQGQVISSAELQFNKDCKLEVVPYPIKNISNFEKLDLKITTKFNFLSIALISPRKNLENLIDWFMQEFKNDDVGLILKTGIANGSLIDRENTSKSIKKIIRKYKNHNCKVYLLHGDLTEKEIHSLYKRDDVHAYVTTTCGEGYGLPIFEAAYSGIPVIATDWSGHLDFLSAPYKNSKKTKMKKLFAKVDYDLKPISDGSVWPGVLEKESRWAFAKEHSFKKQIRNVFKDYGMYKKWAMCLKENLMKTHNPEKILEEMKSVLLSVKKNTDPKDVSGISFCISTNAGKVDKTLLEIKSIKTAMAQVDIPFEIILSGVVEPFEEEQGIVLVESSKSAQTGMLAKLRNDAAEHASHDVIVFVDDDFIFPKSWAKQLISFSKSRGWDVLGNKILLPSGDRFWDRSTMIPHKLVNYDYPDYNHNLYQTGGFWIMRKETYLNHKWNSLIPINAAENGAHPYNEDIDLSIRMHNAGIELCFDKENYVWHDDLSYVEFNNQTIKKDALRKAGVSYSDKGSNKLFNLTIKELKE